MQMVAGGRTEKPASKRPSKDDRGSLPGPLVLPLEGPLATIPARLLFQLPSSAGGPGPLPHFARDKETLSMSQQAITLGELSELVGGRTQGTAAQKISGAAVLGEAASDEITFVDHPDRLKKLNVSAAAAVVVTEKLASELAASGNGSPSKGAIVVTDVHAAFAMIVCHFRPPRTRSPIGISSSAILSPSARVGNNVNIHPGATVGDDCQIGDRTTVLPGVQILAGCVIGSDVLVGPGAVLYENTVVGDRVIIHGCAVIGAY